MRRQKATGPSAPGKRQPIPTMARGSGGDDGDRRWSEDGVTIFLF
jgi:hypothetical protein